MFQGAITALITPFRDGQLDEDALRNIVRWQIDQGIDGLCLWAQQENRQP